MHTQPGNAKLLAQLAYAVLQISPALISPPNGQGICGRWQVRDQRLKPVAFQIKKHLASGFWTLRDTLTHHNKPSAGLIALDFLHLKPSDLGRAPVLLVVAAERLHLLS